MLVGRLPCGAGRRCRGPTTENVCWRAEPGVSDEVCSPCLRTGLVELLGGGNLHRHFQKGGTVLQSSPDLRSSPHPLPFWRVWEGRVLLGQTHPIASKLSARLCFCSKEGKVFSGVVLSFCFIAVTVLDAKNSGRNFVGVFS
ncbi:hypothetical protein IscW_ISCW008364 [Ixodes scapularis]|uniref:Uncharacterized protein n=1 Tax=Ixodes scapularis TaxID=6945 RepID=B7PTK4_IXOSC|nr:hypothetical protein IscW_ISCW008364 [Ixodes scapularis]|eukprot:XP_002404526.1 hypothetical protein IscW_ISCW008364 [Ixodes scapularis]